MSTPDTLVIGSTGLIGRWLIPELTRQGRHVAAMVRNAAERGDELRDWVAAHGGNTELLTVVDGDLTAPGLGLDPLPAVRDVYNLGGRFAFGLTESEARAVNVDGAVAALRWAQELPRLRRFVHISGYRVAGATVTATLYRDKGAYEASKVEADHAVRDHAEAHGIPYAIVNPSTVIGDSGTGETTQFIGLAAMVRDLHRGRLPVIPGGKDVWVPVVTADYFARFLAAVPEHAEPGAALWVLDEDTPLLGELLRDVARTLGVRPPRFHVPVGVIRRLPAKLTGADPETLGFLSADRYPTDSARALAERAGLTFPPLPQAMRAWVDYLVASEFGKHDPARTPVR
ncbi:SDR family oxidoreductase [Rhodococcus maanshanensis]|uniref:Nucleoside-diphosphate-sugar epimerase n=1 Tax=Rhodococcus maanshanensis TaxID=183556 RepID=A0A1H7JGL0_9NOCA|nr:SDR family oxidoreductase [Rhodococcus maanshanensis]SEK73067.1 Nucleoside-diphosphate-sugar epimerase [Rhodococcus maanshanensis]